MRPRSNLTCTCNAYPFPHRWGGGACEGRKWICRDCGHGFDTNVVCVERATWGRWGGEPDDYENLCPECGSVDSDTVEERNQWAAQLKAKKLALKRAQEEAA